MRKILIITSVLLVIYVVYFNTIRKEQKKIECIRKLPSLEGSQVCHNIYD